MEKLAAYDRQMRGLEPKPPAGVRYERDGPLLRAVGVRRGYICGPRDLGVTGAELDRLIARQRDYFAGRGQAVAWQTRAHDEPADLPVRLRAAGFAAGVERTVLIGLAAELATAPIVPGGAALRQVTADGDMHRIAALPPAASGTCRSTPPATVPDLAPPGIQRGDHHHRVRVDAAARQPHDDPGGGRDLTCPTATEPGRPSPRAAATPATQQSIEDRQRTLARQLPLQFRQLSGPGYSVHVCLATAVVTWPGDLPPGRFAACQRDGCGRPAQPVAP